VEVHAVCAIKHIDAIVGVLAGMAVHDVNEHHQPEPVGLVNKSLQLIWSAESAAGLQERTKRMVFRFLMHSFKFLVHNVDEHHQPEPVGLVSKSLQLIWSAKSAAGLQERTERNYFQSVCRQLYY